MTECAICPRLTLTNVQHSPLIQPSIFYFYLLLGLPDCYFVSACVWLGLCVWRLLERSCSSLVTLIAISTVTPGWWTAGQWVCCLSEWVCVYTEPSEIVFLWTTNVRCTVLYLGNVCLCRMCCSVICQWLGCGSVWLQLCRETHTAAGYCPCTCCQGTSLVKNASQQCKVKQEPAWGLTFAVICVVSVLFFTNKKCFGCFSCFVCVFRWTRSKYLNILINNVCGESLIRKLCKGIVTQVQMKTCVIMWLFNWILYWKEYDQNSYAHSS